MKEENEKQVVNPNEGERVTIMGKDFIRKVHPETKRVELYPLSSDDTEVEPKRRKHK